MQKTADLLKNMYVLEDFWLEKQPNLSPIVRGNALYRFAHLYFDLTVDLNTYLDLLENNTLPVFINILPHSICHHFRFPRDLNNSRVSWKVASPTSHPIQWYLLIRQTYNSPQWCVFTRIFLAKFLNSILWIKTSAKKWL